MSKVFITSFSSISSLGIGINESLKNLQKQKQLIHYPEKDDKFNKPYFPINPSLEINSEKNICSQFALKLLDLISDSWMPISPISLFLSTSTGGIKETEEVYDALKNKTIKYPLFKRHFFNSIFNDIKEEYNNKIKDSATFSVACSSSGHSIMQAYELIKNGVIDKALVMGVDVLCLTTMIGFDSLKLVSSTGTRPLTKERDGLSLGDGGGVLLLESKPKTDPIAEIIGTYSNSDGYHISSPDPNGTQQKECILKSIKNANIKIDDIDYINAHGTGTIMNDEVEMKVITSIFPEVLVTSTKAFIGHTLGASAITELALVIEMLKEKNIYQPIDLGEPIDKKYIPLKTVEKKVNYFLKNSFGFGGNNVSIVIKNLF
jgi:3-oxoacyl-[acyl-carrier-protein] synthase-1